MTDPKTTRVQCPKCGLEAKSLLHGFCQHTICPVRNTEQLSIIKEIEAHGYTIQERDRLRREFAQVTMPNDAALRVAVKAFRDAQHQPDDLYKWRRFYQTAFEAALAQEVGNGK